MSAARWVCTLVHHLGPYRCDDVLILDKPIALYLQDVGRCKVLSTAAPDEDPVARETNRQQIVAYLRQSGVVVSRIPGVELPCGVEIPYVP